MSPQIYILLAASCLILGVAAFALIPAPAPPAPLPRPPQRWKCFRITPSRLRTGEGPAIEELPQGMRLATLEKGESWSPRLHLLDPADARRIVLKPKFLTFRNTLIAAVDGRKLFSMRLPPSGDGIELFPEPQAPQWQFSGSLSKRRWELRSGGRTIASAEPESGGSGAADAGSSPAAYFLEISIHESCLPILAFAAAGEILLRL